MRADPHPPLQPKISVMLVDDHDAARAECRRHFERGNTVQIVAEAASGEEACEKYPVHRPQVVVTDILLPGMGGIAAIRRIVARNRYAKIAVFSSLAPMVFVVRALDAGARGYLYKTGGFEPLDAAIARIATGERYLQPEIARQLALRSLGQDASLRALETLTAREFDVFFLLARGLSLTETAARLCLGYNTVASRSRSIRNKLSLADSGEIEAFAHRCALFSR